MKRHCLRQGLDRFVGNDNNCIEFVVLYCQVNDFLDCTHSFYCIPAKYNKNSGQELRMNWETYLCTCRFVSFFLKTENNFPDKLGIYKHHSKILRAQKRETPLSTQKKPHHVEDKTNDAGYLSDFSCPLLCMHVGMQRHKHDANWSSKRTFALLLL